MIFLRSVKYKLQIGETRTIEKFCWLPYITKEAVIWLTDIDIHQMYECDSITGAYKWVTHKITKYDYKRKYKMEFHKK